MINLSVPTGEMGAALEVLVRPEAKVLSASTVARLKQAGAPHRQVTLYKQLSGSEILLWNF